MPRKDWFTSSAHARNAHHKPMKSGRKGKGHDAHLRAAKRVIAEGHRPPVPRNKQGPRRDEDGNIEFNPA